MDFSLSSVGFYFILSKCHPKVLLTKWYVVSVQFKKEKENRYSSRKPKLNLLILCDYFLLKKFIYRICILYSVLFAFKDFKNHKIYD